MIRKIIIMIASVILLTGCSSNIYKLGMTDEEWGAWIDSAPTLRSQTVRCQQANCSYTVSYWEYPDGTTSDIYVNNF